MKIIRGIITVAVLALLAGCSSMRVSSETNMEYDFSRVQSYRWADASTEILDEPGTFVHDRLRQGLDRGLQGHGLLRVESGGDLRAVYFARLAEVEEHVEPRAGDEERLSGGWTLGSGEKKWSYREPQADLVTYTTEVMLLELKLFDAASGEQVWCGTLQTEINRSTPVAEQEVLMLESASRLTDELVLRRR